MWRKKRKDDVERVRCGQEVRELAIDACVCRAAVPSDVRRAERGCGCAQTVAACGCAVHWLHAVAAERMLQMPLRLS